MGKMSTYFFALGTNHTLSKIDIVNTLAMKGVDFEIIEASEEILLISTEVELETKELIEELGSAAKIGKIFREYSKSEWPEKFSAELSNENLQKELVGGKFGISVYGAGGKFKELNKVLGEIRKIRPSFVPPIAGLRKGKEVRKQGRILSTVAVDKNELLENGFELVICVGSKGIYVGKTLAIQDYESYSFRDYGRPRRDVKSGMIPPKLAKMMINLAGKDKGDVFLDPFCGSGTFLQELILLGYGNVIGSDAGVVAIKDTKVNLEWLFKNYPEIKKEDYKIELFECDARSLSSKIPPQKIDAIVTEPYLGSAKRKFFEPEQIKKEISQLEDLYLSAFQEFKKVLRDNGEVVIIFPVFRYQNQFFHLQILDKIYSLGFRSGRFLSEGVKGRELLQLQITKRNSVIFFRPGQLLSREILLFLV